MKYSMPYFAYIILLGIAPFAATFLLAGVGVKSIVLVYKLYPIYQIIANTFIYTTVTSVLATLIGLLAAIAIDAINNKTLQLILAFLVMLPYTIPFTSAALIWSISFYGPYGWFTYLLGLKYDPLLLSSTAMLGVILVSVWGSIPMSFLIIFSSLKSVPKEIKENTLMDGMKKSEYYFKIALPLIGKAVLIVFLLSFVFSLGAFDTPYILTGGGPLFSTTTLGLAVYTISFKSSLRQALSGGAFAAAILAVIATIPALLYVKALRAQRVPFPSLNIKINNKLMMGLITIFLFLLIFFLDFPIYYMFLAAFRTPEMDFTSPPVLLPVGLTSSYFIQALKESIPYLISTVVVSLISPIISILLASPASYEISRGKNSWILPLSMYLYSLPVMVFIIPIYIFISKINLLNTWWALIITMPLYGALYALWLMYNYFTLLPKSYDETAELFGIKNKFLRIIMPLSRPALFSTLLLLIIGSWHALFVPLVLTETPYNFSFPPKGAQTLSIFALLAIGDVSVNWSLLAASAVVTALPVMILSIISITRVLKGSYSGGIKFI
ncbi:ABC-type sugar transport system, permease component [Caldisphaera lagunensis DSM 15908]|uniref:ABC-type sugar transport system, permease component n=1 Tax=Caldisphaera lagunensis (strain DSM 15908 / JCM 11604 / ANMR 0165 / IC-154) TaxID=1056495 RepID=L0ACL1_CALLD|nr:ABC transporter permease subunit [Caldisphaera lagunensis]AFZ70795.1 ABC-type sugar transport system, permease component [Caldisphaera lagunensis DSM 15908]